MPDILSEEDIETADNVRVLEMLEEGVIIRRLQDNEGFKLIDKICKGIAENAKRKILHIGVNAENMTAIIELQIIAKMYGDFLGNIRKSFIDTGELAFNEAKNRGLIEVPEQSE